MSACRVMAIFSMVVFCDLTIYAFICSFDLYAILFNTRSGCLQEENRITLETGEEDKRLKKQLEYQHKTETPQMISQHSFVCYMPAQIGGSYNVSERCPITLSRAHDSGEDFCATYSCTV